MKNEDRALLKQMIPAPPNLFSKTDADNGYIYSPIVCIAMDGYGAMHFCDSDDSGYIETVSGDEVVIYEDGQYNDYCKYVIN